MKRLFIGDVVSNNNCSSGSGNILRLGQLDKEPWIQGHHLAQGHRISKQGSILLIQWLF